MKFIDVKKNVQKEFGKFLNPRNSQKWKQKKIANKPLVCTGRPRIRPSTQDLLDAVDKYTKNNEIPNMKEMKSIANEASRKLVSTFKNPVGHVLSDRSIRRSIQESGLKKISLKPRPNNRKDAEFDIRNAISESVVVHLLLYPYDENLDQPIHESLIKNLDPCTLTIGSNITETGFITRRLDLQHVRYNKQQRPFTVKMVSNQSGDGKVAPLVFVLADEALQDGLILKLMIPGLSPYPDTDGYVWITKSFHGFVWKANNSVHNIEI